MATDVIEKKEITQLLNDWYQEMCLQHVIKATKLKEEIDNKIERIEEDPDILTYYSLLGFRYQMLVGNFKSDYNKPFSEQQTNTFLQYYYHFFKFIYATEITNYSEAKVHYQLAEKLLDNLPDEVEKAEFHYRVSIFHYYSSQPVLAIHYATKAQEFFSKHEGYEIKTGACKNTLGLACITLEQHELAEEYLLGALDLFNKTNEDSLIIRVRHNLGLMYADQDLSEIAIRHLTDAYNASKHYRTTYLLARENYKLQNKEEASKYIEEGLKTCNKDYEHHFLILKAKNDKFSVEKAEGIFLPAIEYFKEQALWKDVHLYSEELANEWYKVGNESKVSTYFHMSYQARQILRKQEALK